MSTRDRKIKPGSLPTKINLGGYLLFPVPTVLGKWDNSLNQNLSQRKMYENKYIFALTSWQC